MTGLPVARCTQSMMMPRYASLPQAKLSSVSQSMHHMTRSKWPVARTASRNLSASASASEAVPLSPPPT